MNSHVGADPKCSSSGCCFRQPGTAVRGFKPRQQGTDLCSSSSFQPVTGGSLRQTLPPNTAAVSSHPQPSLDLSVLSWNNTYFWPVWNPGVTNPITQQREGWKSLSSTCCQSRGAEATPMLCLTCLSRGTHSPCPSRISGISLRRNSSTEGSWCSLGEKKNHGGTQAACVQL